MCGDRCANMSWHSQLDGMGYFGLWVVASMLRLVDLLRHYQKYWCVLTLIVRQCGGCILRCEK